MDRKDDQRSFLVSTCNSCVLIKLVDNYKGEARNCLFIVRVVLDASAAVDEVGRLYSVPALPRIV